MNYILAIYYNDAGQHIKECQVPDTAICCKLSTGYHNY